MNKNLILLKKKKKKLINTYVIQLTDDSFRTKAHSKLSLAIPCVLPEFQSNQANTQKKKKIFLVVCYNVELDPIVKKPKPLKQGNLF